MKKNRLLHINVILGVSFLTLISFISPEMISKVMQQYDDESILFSVRAKVSESGEKVDFYYVFENQSSNDKLLAYYLYPVVLYDAEPKDAFVIKALSEHPINTERHAPATKDNVMLIKAGEKLVQKLWRWTENYSELVDKDGKIFHYEQKKPQRVKLIFQYYGRELQQRFGYPESVQWFTGKLKAEVVVNFIEHKKKK